MIKLHFGTIQYAGTLRFDTGRSYFTRKEERVVTTHYVVHPVKRLYGVSWKASWLLGFVTFDSVIFDRPQSVEPTPPSRTGDAS